MFRIAESVARILAASGIVLAICMVGAVFFLPTARAEDVQDTRCRDALNSFNTSGWAIEKMPRPDQCTDDIRLYVTYLAAIATDQSEKSAQAEQSSLLAAADAGNRSAQLLCDKLSAPLVRFYRNSVSDAITD